MNMHWIDWGIVVFLLAIMIAAAIHTRRYTRSVADFLVANRCAGRYVLTVAEGVAGLGAISIIGAFEMYYSTGFSGVWWGMMIMPATMIISLSGWVIYRYRQTRTLTLGQFLEVRYSRNFRVFMGLVSYAAGIINFGVFPAVGARFFIYFCGLPDQFIFAGMTISSFATAMFILLSISLTFTFMGGQVTVIVTDFLQGMFCNIVYVILLIYLLLTFDWAELIQALQSAPVDASLINPIHSGKADGFNVSYFLIAVFGLFYSSMSWQGSQGYNASARTPHEARMGKIWASWRNIAQVMLLVLMPLCAYAVLHGAGSSDQVESVQSVLDSIDHTQIQKQMTVPVVLSVLFPVGLFGAFCAVMLAAFISTHDTYLHSWGSIFIQDVIMPFRKEPFTPKQHMRVLRISIFGVAVFIFIWSLLVPLNDHIRMFFAITGAIYLGGSGSVIIGGLYWKHGTTRAAWCAMITGSSLAVGRIIIGQIDPDFPINGQILWFIAMMASIMVYIVVSLLDKQPAFNMDKMLHRGEYTIVEDQTQGDAKPVRGLRALLGMGKEFTLRDRVVYLSSIGWTILWSVIFLAGTAYSIIFEVDDTAWAAFWRIYIFVNLGLGIFVTIWISIGGVRDIRALFRRLSECHRDDADDGTVVDDQPSNE